MADTAIAELNAIVNQALKSARYIDPGYLNANSVWQVDTEQETFIIKVSRLGEKPEGPFWNGLKHLFDSYAYFDLPHFEKLCRFVKQRSPLAIPEIKKLDISKSIINKNYMIIEYLPGSPPTRQSISKDIARQFGIHLGSLHKTNFDYFGNFGKGQGFAGKCWGQRLADTLDFIANGWFAENKAVIGQLPQWRAQAAKSLPVQFSLIMPDLSWSQFLESNGRLAALVDLEALVVGPPELDLVIAEYMLTPDVVADFISGYEQYCPLPKLADVRMLYRFLYHLMEIDETLSFSQWMNQPLLLQ